MLFSMPIKFAAFRSAVANCDEREDSAAGAGKAGKRLPGEQLRWNPGAQGVPLSKVQG